MISTEHVISTLPFVVRRRVKWGECDPAGVVYTACFAEYVISAAELFYTVLFGEPSQRAKEQHGFGTPTRALQFDFRRPLRPDEEFDMAVVVRDIRTRTYVLEITARTADRAEVFQALLTPICITRSDRRAIEIPPVFRSALQRYQDPGTPDQ